MSKTWEQGRAAVIGLCDYFKANQEAYCAPGVKEAHVRQSLIDPFFEALGWDVRNAQMNAPQNREVIPEDSLDVEGHQKSPDYTFRVGRTPIFFAEAKRCGVNIATDPGPAYQLRRYGFSAKVALSFLTDFAESAVYDCSMRPYPSDKASHARTLYFGFAEYPDRWRELWDVFSREAVWGGSFDQYAASKRKRGTSEVDDEFLKEIEGWREALARNIAVRNAAVSADDLNAAVQMTIDRVVFLRMAEDRGLEPYEQLLKLCERPDIYARFMRDLCRRADERYNSGLFHFRRETDVSETPDQITPKLNIDDKVFKPILQSLYFEYGSPYHFGVMPVEILGTVYERFLGKVIRLTAGHYAKVEEKPEVRKAGGVYYTPSYIVDYIVKNTVGRQIEGKSPAQLAGGKDKPPFRVLDIACGSGSFLLGAYQFLLDHFLKWYLEHKPETQTKAVYQDARAGDWRLRIGEKKRILTAHIFGVDIDRQAVEVTKLSLLLKALENENEASFSQQLEFFPARVLPNLAENIKCGNSLIGTDFYAGQQVTMFGDHTLQDLNVFDWDGKDGFPAVLATGGFDAVIGNPPYVGFHGFAEQKDYLRTKYISAKGKFDIYLPFIEKALTILKERGMFGFICPTNFMKRGHGHEMRAKLKTEYSLTEIVDFEDVQIFEGALNYTGIYLIEGEPPDRDHCVRYKARSLSDVGFLFPQGALGDGAWLFSNETDNVLVDKIQRAGGTLLGDMTRGISEGIVTGKNDVFLVPADVSQKNGFEREVVHPCIRGRNIRRYYLDPVDEVVLYPYRRSGNKTLPLQEEEIKGLANVWSYLVQNRPNLKGRAYFESSTKKWYELWCQRSLDLIAAEKIVVPELAESNRFALATAEQFYGDTVCGIVLRNEIPESLRYLLGVLNSRLIEYYYKRTTVPKANAFYIYKTMFLKKIPIRRIDFARPKEKKDYDRIVVLVETMLELSEGIAKTTSEREKTLFQRQIDATDAEIDRLVYDLYGLTDEEIAIVEGAGA